jgi:thiosulfate dehydrogenase
MKNPTRSLSPRSLTGTLLLPAALLGLLATSSAREPYTAAELAMQEAALLKLVDRGRDIWHGTRADMANNGLACGNCHPDAAAANPQTFPKYMPMFNKVVPFREMVNWCIQNPQGGKALDVNGDDMTAMEAYAFNLYRGEKIEPGLATRQTPPIVVKSGVGYAKKGSGLGYDK